MAEADFLTLLTVVPSDPRLLTVTIQPLLCSDVLDLKTDRIDGSPLKAVTRFADNFGSGAPDHVDIVSVATCTPQRSSHRRLKHPFREWPEQFLRAFENAASGADFARHHFATFILANFRTVGKRSPGGLSGTFLPVSPGRTPFHADVLVSAFGRLKGSASTNTWSKPKDAAQTKWDNRGFVAGLNPFSDPHDCPVRIFTFHIHRLPRQYSLWEKPSSLARCTVQIGRRDDVGTLRLETKGMHHE